MVDREKNPIAFVIMPFDSEFEIVFNKLIKPPLVEIGYTVIRGDSLLNQQNILKDIIRGIAEADLIIADLTSLNSNVFYELGVSHTLKKSTVLLCQSIEEIPFDLKAYRIITYSVHFSDAFELSDKLKEIGEKAKKGSISFGNPVTDFLFNYSGEKQLPSFCTKKLHQSPYSDVDTETDEKGIWDFIVGGENSINEINICVEQLSRAQEKIANSFHSGTEELVHIQQQGGLGMASRIQKHASDMAEIMNQFAYSLEKVQPKFHESLTSFDENTTGIVTSPRLFSTKDLAGAISLRTNLSGLKNALNQNLDPLRRFRDTNMNLKGISKDMNRASKRVIRILELLIADLEGAESFCVKSLTLLNERIENEQKELQS